MAGAEVGGGRVELTLDGKPCYLEPSLEACIEVSKLAGGLGGAMDRCRALHFESICAIVGAGIVINGSRLNPRQREDLLPKAIYEAGVIGVAAACMEFITIIGRGGRPAPDDDEDEGDGKDRPLG